MRPPSNTSVSSVSDAHGLRSMWGLRFTGLYRYEMVYRPPRARPPGTADWMRPLSASRMYRSAGTGAPEASATDTEATSRCWRVSRTATVSRDTKDSLSPVKSVTE